MPSPGPSLSSLVAIKNNLAQLLAAETAAQLTGGAKPSYSLDGESYSWTEWRTAVLEKIEKLNVLIQLESGPFQVVSQRRA
jgi:hypothetical protein